MAPHPFWFEDREALERFHSVGHMQGTHGAGGAVRAQLRETRRSRGGGAAPTTAPPPDFEEEEAEAEEEKEEE